MPIHFRANSRSERNGAKACVFRAISGNEEIMAGHEEARDYRESISRVKKKYSPYDVSI